MDGINMNMRDVWSQARASRDMEMRRVERMSTEQMRFMDVWHMRFWEMRLSDVRHMRLSDTEM